MTNKKLRQELQYIRDNITNYNDLTQYQRHAISDGSKSAEKEIRGLAQLCAFNILSGLAKKMIAKSNVISDVDDGLQEAFLCVATHLEEWNPKYALTTFYNNKFLQIFTYNSESPINKTQHGHRIDSLISAAISDLEKVGCYNASPHEICEFIQTQYTGSTAANMSPRTVEERMKKKIDCTSLDRLNEDTGDRIASLGNNPEDEYIRQERNELFWRIIEEDLEPLQRQMVLILNEMLNTTEEDGEDSKRKSSIDVPFPKLYAEYKARVQKPVTMNEARIQLEEAKRVIRNKLREADRPPFVEVYYPEEKDFRAKNVIHTQQEALVDIDLELEFESLAPM